MNEELVKKLLAQVFPGIVSRYDLCVQTRCIQIAGHHFTYHATVQIGLLAQHKELSIVLWSDKQCVSVHCSFEFICYLVH